MKEARQEHEYFADAAFFCISTNTKKPQPYQTAVIVCWQLPVFPAMLSRRSPSRRYYRELSSAKYLRCISAKTKKKTAILSDCGLPCWQLPIFPAIPSRAVVSQVSPLHQCKNQKENRNPYQTAVFRVGSYLFSRAVASQVSSARQSLTSVFGMGTGGPSAPMSPTLNLPERMLIENQIRK